MTVTYKIDKYQQEWQPGQSSPCLCLHGHLMMQPQSHHANRHSNSRSNWQRSSATPTEKYEQFNSDVRAGIFNVVVQNTGSIYCQMASGERIQELESLSNSGRAEDCAVVACLL